MTAEVQEGLFPAVIKFCTAGADLPDHCLRAGTEDSHRGQIVVVCCDFGKNAFEIGPA